MASRSKFGFPVYFGYRYRLAGRRQVLIDAGIKSLELLSTIHSAIPQTVNPYWLLPFRDKIRTIHRLDAKSILSHVVDSTSDRNIRILAIWSRGRCGGHLGTEMLAKYATFADDTIRKEVVRALVRMNAWSRLAAVAENEVNPRIRRLATSRPPAEFTTRLGQFGRNVARTLSRAGRQPFYIAGDLEITQSKPGKPVSFIRAVLERIRDLVHGPQSHCESGDYGNGVH